MENIFLPETAANLIARINHLTPETKPLWGKMNAPQMLAHVNVAYEMAFENKHKKPGVFMRWMLKMFVKDTVCGPKPYKHNSQTAPAFLITSDKDFGTEKNRLIGYLNKSVELGEDYFDGKESLSFGKLTKEEWNVMFHKHLEHHLSQFNV
ncbi:DUF1569 domain-containing protein [Dyadobacter aurulentus]|uniref:DUF1569 domain-containing protein n=1 Tax=Dyadobacter sp. UC 10 TaxID=2605428 RepID=UPI0011F0A561|nr:DUF1569 domain-containing protein [Dyadobacter sp. UC 10]KAA0993265.1 DUF1569 domain-containing protein [Dyadobacter sp. UC 10]